MTGVARIETVWQRFGSLINSTLIIIGALAMIWQGGAYVERTETNIRVNAAEITRLDREQAAKWSALAEQQKTRMADVQSISARHDERIKGVEAEARKINSIVDKLTYQTAANEQATISANQAIKEFQGTLSQLGGDMRVVREILTRIEAGQRKSSP